MPLDGKVEQLGTQRPLALTYTPEPAEIREAGRKLRQMRRSANDRRLALGFWIVWLMMAGVAALFLLGATQEEAPAFVRAGLTTVLVLLAVQAVVHLIRAALPAPLADWPRSQLEIYEHTVAVKLPLSSSSFSWSALQGFAETRRTFVLDFNTGEAVVIPKRLLAEADLPRLRELILRKLRHAQLRA